MVDSYFRKGVDQLLINRERVEPVSEQLLDVLDDTQGKQAVGELVSQWQGLKALKQANDDYTEAADLHLTAPGAVETANRKQQELRAKFDPFFQQLHTGLKQLDKVVRQHEKARAEDARNAGKRITTDRNARRLKEALEELHKEVLSAESFYQHIHWLQERFPNAEYEDVTGLCKLATPEEVKEQDYSLNPGRYVGVVIEEDGKTEGEFIASLLSYADELEALNSSSDQSRAVIANNLKMLLGD